MKVYASMDPRLPLSQVASHAQRIEALGYDGLHVPETIHDSLAVSLLALEHTDRLTVRTAVTLAFVRSPTAVAYTAWDLSSFSAGRFELGLGTQIRQNIEDRYGMPWGEPVERLADYVAAVQDLFESFSTGGPIDHRGTHYEITRLQPYFNPGPAPEVAVPPIFLGGVGPQMCALAGRIADGFVTHPTNSNPRYLTEICRPNIERGAADAGRSLDDVELVVGTQVITGLTVDALAIERERQRQLFAFLYSTPAYRQTLELYGWDHLGDELRRLTRAERWDELASVVTDEILETLVPAALLSELPALLLDRFGALADGILLSAPATRSDDEALAVAIASLQSGAA